MAEAPDVKRRIHRELARVGHALASERRLDLIDLLAQAPRSVDVLAGMAGMSVASTSQHLQVLRQARLVEPERAGARVVYRLADESVLQLWIALACTARQQLPEVAEVDRQLSAAPSRADAVDRADISGMLKRGEAVLIDVRPAAEFAHGHLPGALSLPLDELPQRLRELPRRKLIVTYCRGTYCLSADDAIAHLREHGYRAVRLEGGWPEWRAEGRPAGAAAT